MSFTLFNALQIFKLTKLTIQPTSVEAEWTFSTCGLFAMTPYHNRCIVLHTECIAKAVNVKNAWFASYIKHWF